MFQKFIIFNYLLIFLWNLDEFYNFDMLVRHSINRIKIKCNPNMPNSDVLEKRIAHVKLPKIYI